MSGIRNVTMTPGAVVRLRAFRDDDYPRLAEIGSLAFPDEPWSAEEIRHADAAWDHARYDFLRVVAEDADGRMVGVGRISHAPWEFHPRKYSMTITVEPASRRRGIGTALYAGLIQELWRRWAIAVRAWVASETMTESLAFLGRRGFVEVQRGWQSRLDVAAFDFTRLAGAVERIAREGIALTTLAAERASDLEAVRKAYELDKTCSRDVPGTGEPTDVPFERFVAHAIESPKALPMINEAMGFAKQPAWITFEKTLV